MNTLVQSTVVSKGQWHAVKSAMVL